MSSKVSYILYNTSCTHFVVLQLILKCNAGMNFMEFNEFLTSITMPRLKQLEQILITYKETGTLEGYITTDHPM